MMAFFYKGIPEYHMKGFCAVRDAFDNLSNVLHLVELVNTCSHCRISAYDEQFDFVIFTDSVCRAVIRKADGFFSMSIPFQAIENGDNISFNFDLIAEEVNGQFISIIRNAILTSREELLSHDNIICSLADHFGLDYSDAILYFDAYVTLLADDHGYFRFDDDIVNQKDNVHPRYHFDFFYKNSSSVKIGIDKFVDIECFYAFLDKTIAKKYIR